ncbi:MAG: M66 family metalloprotease [Akkermansiaceae bacterium]|nr:M66 family metalloprotease [Akkermansiaceae bacterium]
MQTRFLRSTHRRIVTIKAVCRSFILGTLTFALASFHASAAPQIDAVYVAQTHMHKTDHPYFRLVAQRDAHIKVHVVDPAMSAAPEVKATLNLNGKLTEIPLTGPATLPASIPDGPGVVEHTASNSFTGTIPAALVQRGLTLSVTAGSASTDLGVLNVGAPTKVIMTMLDVHYFTQTTGDYPDGWQQELESKWPVADLEVRRTRDIVFPELVIPPRGDVGAPAARVKSKADYTAQTGLNFDGEQAAALQWNRALKRAAGRNGRVSLYYTNIYGVGAGGQAGGFAGVGNGKSAGILHHELGHALSLPHWGGVASYPYQGEMYGIQAPKSVDNPHAGPTWAFDPPTQTYITCILQEGNARNDPPGTYKVDPMWGGGTGHQEAPFIYNHFSDYSVYKMRDYLEQHVVIWNESLGEWARWNDTDADYTTVMSNNGVEYPVQRDVEVISVLAAVSGAKPDVCMLYPPIGPYTTGLIRLFDPRIEADRIDAQAIYAPTHGCDVSVRLIQGGVEKIYMLPASWRPELDPLSGSSFETQAINLPASDGPVTFMELLLTPDAEINGLPEDPEVLYTWSPPLPNPASFAEAPAQSGPGSISMTATTGTLPADLEGPIEYLFTETTGNPGGDSSGWQTSSSYTDDGLIPGVLYRYTVTMRANSRTGAPSKPACAAHTGTTETTPPTLAASDIVDDRDGAEIIASNTITYLVSFSEMMDVTSISAADFSNAGTAPINILSAKLVCPLSIVEVVVRPTGSGTLRLRIHAGAELLDLAGNALNTDSAIVDDTSIHVTVDTTPPTLAATDIVDSVSGAPILEYQSVDYTLTFSEPLDPATVSAQDFENAGTSPVLITNVSVNEERITLSVTPDYPGAGGTLQLQVKAGALITDVYANAMETTTPVADNTVITVNAEDTPPVISAIESPVAANSIHGLPTIPYRITIEDAFIDESTITADIFSNVGSATVNISNLSKISEESAASVYRIELTPTSAGTVQLAIAGTIADIFGNLAAPVMDDAVYSLSAVPDGNRETIQIVQFVEGVGAGGSGDKTLLTNFDASAGDKLVVVVGGEHGFSGNIGGAFYSMTYGGQAMTLAVQEEAGVPTAAIFYLDHPGAAGDLVVNQDNHNGTEFAVYVLTGTREGIGITAKSTTNRVDLITATSGARVIAGVLNAGPEPNGGNNAPDMSADPPLIEDTQTHLYSGSAWTSLSSASNNIATPSAVACSFSGSSSAYLMATVAVEIEAAFSGPSYLAWTQGTFTGSLDKPDPGADFDGGGLANTLEWVLGGDPTDSGDDAGLIPLFDNTSDPDFLIFTYFVRNEAAGDSKTNIQVEYGSTLGSWSAAAPSSNITYTTTPDGGGSGSDRVDVKLRRTLSVNGKLFVRLRATINP